MKASERMAPVDHLDQSLACLGQLTMGSTVLLILVSVDVMPIHGVFVAAQFRCYVRVQLIGISP